MLYLLSSCCSVKNWFTKLAQLALIWCSSHLLIRCHTNLLLHLKALNQKACVTEAPRPHIGMIIKLDLVVLFNIQPKAHCLATDGLDHALDSGVPSCMAHTCWGICRQCTKA